MRTRQPEGRQFSRRVPRAALPFMLACLLAAWIPFALPTPARVEIADFPGWPAQFEGRALRALPLSASEQRFATDFPGRMARFTDGQREIVLRWVSAPTRKLHPAADCFRGSGYSVTALPMELASGGRWSSFEARRGAQRLHVREAIIATDGNRWTDVSSWYWAAVRDRTQRPWWAITVASSATPGDIA